MSDEEGNSSEHNRFQGEPSNIIKEGKEKEDSGATEESSSSSSDGSNEPEVAGQQNLRASSAQHPTALLDGSHVIGMPNHSTALSIFRPARVFGSSHGDNISKPNLSPEMQNLYSQLPNQLGSRSGGSVANRVPWTNWHPQLGPQEVQYQGLLNQANESGTFYTNGDVPSQIQHQNFRTHQALEPFTSGPNIPSQFEAGNWTCHGEGTEEDLGDRTHAPSNIRYMKNTVYDPIYETMGLPVDPHLRIFIARHNGGNQ